MSEKVLHAPASSAVPLVYTIREVVPLLQLSRNSVRKLLQSGELQSVRCGRKWLIPVEALSAFLSQRPGSRK